jgi:hypothetical protein
VIIIKIINSFLALRLSKNKPMRKNYTLLLAGVMFATQGYGQLKPCYTDEKRKEIIAANPEVEKFAAEYEQQIAEALKRIDLTKAAKTTGVDQSGNENYWYDIPIVVHVIHDYNLYTLGGGGDYISDDNIFNSVKSWNKVFAKQNPDTADVLPTFRKWIGNPHIRLHLATRDPNGNPTKGITRRRNYLTYSANDFAKFDGWPPANYVNIWFIQSMTKGSEAAAYALLPAYAASNPQSDGVISLAAYIDYHKTINHELAHCFNLSHVWGGTNEPEVACGDDGVDDTPPTKGHSPSSCSMADVYDTVCAANYYKTFTTATGIGIINYPDTTNAQNIMDYTYCDKMFTIGQVKRMHLTLNNPIAGRNNLWDTANLVATGVMTPSHTMINSIDLKPIPDFSVVNTADAGNYLRKNGNFAFPGKEVKFINQSWNDTVTNLLWTFSNGALKPTDISTTTVNNSFSVPGWVTVSMKATGNHTGDSTKTWNNAVFVTDVNPTNAVGYIQDFDASGDRDKWVSFNYFDNEFKWQLANTGIYGGNCIQYKGFDDRLDPALGLYPRTGNPKGDYDDLYTVPMDLSAFTDYCNLNYWYAGASRSSNSLDISDTMMIEYSVDKSLSWKTLKIVSKSGLVNNGTYATSFTPTSMSQWSPMTIPLPADARKSYVVFRFKYFPGVGQTGVFSSSNNFYMDRINFSRNPAEASNLNMGATDVAVVPNPTSGSAWVVVKDADNTEANIVVTDITGKVVYRATSAIKGNEARIEIPAEVLAVKGVYLVQTATGNQVHTNKLVVY